MGFRLEVSLSTHDDDLWPMRCPRYEREHVFKVPKHQGKDDPEVVAYCPYCGYHSDDFWDFAQDQKAVLDATAKAAAEQYVSARVDDLLDKAFGRRSKIVSSSGGFRLGMEVSSRRRPARRSLPRFDVEQTRRTMGCESCGIVFAVYGLALYCPRCGKLAPSAQFAELLRVQRKLLESLAALPADTKQDLVESGGMTAIFEATVKSGIAALETYLKQRFAAEASPAAQPSRRDGAVFQRLNEAADLYQKHLDVDLRSRVGPEAWSHLLRMVAVRHVLVHSSGIIDAQFIERQPEWPQLPGQRIHISEEEVHRLLATLEGLTSPKEPPRGATAPDA